ncbi:LysR family transcriptional regulator [Candidatus Odyssella acanthamoebae]|uniref:HTH lysR-type domain-containing protein n=1 Tax=Candidatus Odyssella acanthamoebae TaxID=91604 RepID=A0A077AWY4_9PROT|nr:LysR family transcriptional regulator [Candidatus Paracaedibacter acanthamoebae]AIK97061.1 hypothetical protein ID47_10450 [Candidatus Paracaedibacter acanthamoebae]
MRPIDLSKLRPFYMVAKEGNITKAARKLNVTQPSLSELISDLEYNMKAQLFERLPRGVRLTPQGERLFIHAQKMVEEHEAFEKVFYEKNDEIEGNLKIITMPFGGSEWLVPTLKGFLERHPEINIKILLRSENIEPTEGDVVICPLILHQPHLIQKYLYTAHTKLFASQSYLKKFGTPRTIEELNHHRLIVYRSNYYTPYGSTNWLLNIGIQEGQGSRKPYFEIDSLNGMINSALHGYGIVELPDLSIPLTSSLVDVLPEISGPAVEMYYTFPEKRKNSKKINLLFKHLSKNVSQWEGRKK